MSNLPKRSGMRASKEDVSVTLPESSAIAMVKALKVEPISKTPVVSRLMRVGSSACARIVGIVVGHRDHGDDLAGADVEHDPGGGERLELRRARHELVAQRVLHAQVDRQLDRRLQAVGGEPRQVQRREPVAVEPLLHAGDALIVDVDVADHVGDFGAVGIGALVLAEEADTGQADPVDVLLLLRRDLALEPDEAALRGEPFAQFGGVEIGQFGGEQLDRLVDIDDVTRLAVERGHAHVGGQHFAAAVEDVGTRRGNRVAGGAVPRRPAVGDDREHDEPRGNDAVDRRENEDRQADPRPRLGRAIDVAAVEQAAQQPPAPGLGVMRGCRSAVALIAY